MSEKALQMFTDEYLENCRQMKPIAILKYLDDFRKIYGPKKAKSKSKLISIKIQPDLLDAFKTKANLEGMAYQTQIKTLMQEWLDKK
jgi:predicted DNA binding CopG/RHH family protein